MANPVNALKEMSTPPTEEASFNAWLQLDDALAFLKENTSDSQFILYASRPKRLHARSACSVGKRHPAEY